MEEEQLSDPIDAPQMAYRIESHLTNVGPLYLFSEDENGNPWAFHGEERERDARTEAGRPGKDGRPNNGCRHSVHGCLLPVL